MLISPAPHGTAITQYFDGQNINEQQGWLDTVTPVHQKGRRLAFNPSIEQEHAHLALDYDTPVGTILVAPQTCLIAAQGQLLHFPDGSYDGEIYAIGLIRRTPVYQVTFLLTHLSRFIHVVGARVLQGQPMCVSGRSGRVTGSHTHFEVAVIPAGVSITYFWNKAYYRYNPLTMYAGGSLADSVLTIPNI